MTDDANEFVAEGEYEPSGRNTVALGFALLMIGFAAGAIVAALMTPKTGKQMRRELKRKASDLRDRMDDSRVQESFEHGSMPQIHVSIGALAASAPPPGARVSGD